MRQESRRCFQVKRVDLPQSSQAVQQQAFQIDPRRCRDELALAMKQDARVEKLRTEDALGLRVYDGVPLLRKQGEHPVHEPLLELDFIKDHFEFERCACVEALVLLPVFLEILPSVASFWR